MPDTSLVASAAAVAVTVGQTLAGLLRLDDMKRKIAKLAHAVEEELPEDIAAMGKRIDDLRTSVRRSATGSQPSIGVVGEMQALRDRMVSAERKLEELERRIGEHRAAFETHKTGSDRAWHDLTIELTEIGAALRGVEGLTGGRDARGRRG